MTKDEVNVAFDLAASGKLFALTDTQIEKFFDDHEFKNRLYATYRAMSDLQHYMDEAAVNG